MRGFSGAFLAVSGLLYSMLMTNFLLALTCAPVWVLLLLVDLRTSWLMLAACAILLAPALAGAYAVFRDYSLNGSVTAVRTYFRAWWASWGRVGLPGLFFQVFFFVVGVDLYVMTLWGYGTLALPLTVMLVAVGALTAMVGWVGLAARPDLRRRDVLKASLYLAIRRPGWSLLSLVVLGLLASILWVKPAIGLGLLIGPGLYVVWGNSRRTLISLLPASEQVIPEEA